jgi:hypothetical protein
LHVGWSEKAQEVAATVLESGKTNPRVAMVRFRDGIFAEIRELDIKCAMFVRRHKRQVELRCLPFRKVEESILPRGHVPDQYVIGPAAKGFRHFHSSVEGY